MKHCTAALAVLCITACGTSELDVAADELGDSDSALGAPDYTVSNWKTTLLPEHCGGTEFVCVKGKFRESACALTDGGYALSATVTMRFYAADLSLLQHQTFDVQCGEASEEHCYPFDDVDVARMDSKARITGIYRTNLAVTVTTTDDCI